MLCDSCNWRVYLTAPAAEQADRTTHQTAAYKPQRDAYLVVSIVIHEPELQGVAQHHLACCSPLAVCEGQVGTQGTDGGLLELPPVTPHTTAGQGVRAHTS